MAAACGGEGTPDGVRSEDNSSYCPGPNTLQGVDVSSWQGGINWGAVAGSGRAFAVARVSDGMYVDPDFAGNWNGIKNAGLVRGVYQFFEPTENAVAQADLMLSRLSGYGQGDLPPTIDIEVSGVSPGYYNAQIHAWVSRVQQVTGRMPILYVGSYFWDGNIGTGDFANYPLWLPAYGPYCPRLPAEWTRWVIHQYSSTGSVPGIGGHVDLDLFDGTRADLQKLAGMVSCTPHCEGTVMVGADCNRGDCASFGATCVEPGGVRCVGLPRGSLDGAGCDVIRGWAQDVAQPNAAAAVDLYFDGPIHSGAPTIRVTANQHRDDLCQAIGSCDHGFTVDTPAWLRDGRAHQVFAYGVSSVDEAFDTELGGSPKAFRCAAALAGDFNGDGRADLIQWRGDLSSIPVCLSAGSGWSCKGLEATYVGGIGAGNGGAAVWDGATPLLGRFDADKWIDLYQYAQDWASIPVCASLATGWSCRNAPATYVGTNGPGNAGSGIYPGTRPLVGDVDGDHLDDVIEYRSDGATLPVCTALGTGWSCRDLDATYAGGDFPAGNNGSGLYAGGTALVGDFDGDGRKDVIQYNDTWQSIPVCTSLGTGWSCKNLAATYAGGDAPGNNGSGIHPGSTPLVADFDGDGRDDLIEFNANNPFLSVCTSLGSGWSCRALHADYAGGDFGPGVGGSGIYGGAPLVGDFNGDHRADVVQYSSDWQSLPTCISLGTGWSCKNLRATLAGGGPGNQGSGIYATGEPIVADFDGDGRSDVLQFQDAWQSIPVCLSLGSGWSCKNLGADYVGGTGAGNGGSGVY